MKLILARILYISGDIMCRLIPYDITGLCGKLYQKFMLISVDLDTDCVIWKHPDDSRVTIKGKLKIRK